MCEAHWSTLSMSKATLTKRDYNDLFDSREIVKSYKKAFPILIFAARLGHPHAQNLLGYCYDRGLVTRRDPKVAAHWYKHGAQKGHVEAIYNLALCYAHGTGTQNAKQALALYRKAALMGHRWAQCNLGVMYSEGIGTGADSSVAASWYRKAAHQGDAKAQYNLGVCYLDGDGVRKSRRLAIEWFKDAATRGHKKAENELRQLLQDTRRK